LVIPIFLTKFSGDLQLGLLEYQHIFFQMRMFNLVFYIT